MSRNTVIFLCLVLCIATTVPPAGWTQTRGKISGKVIDGETGKPLFGANVMVKGTTTGAATDMVGEYFIINLPAGIFEVEAWYLGYGKTIIRDVRVSVNHNTRVDFKLYPTVLQGENVVVTAERAELEMVKMDLPTAEIVLDVREVSQTPTDDLIALLSMQPGIEFIEGLENEEILAPREIYGDDHQAFSTAQGISVRGGESRETLTLLDGMPLMNEHEDVSYFGFSETAVEAMEILTGGFSSEYGNAASGVVNVVTREVSNGYSLNFNEKYSPIALKHFGPSVHDQNNPFWQTFGSENSITGEGTPLPFPGGWQGVVENPPIQGLYYPEAYRLLWRYQHRNTRDYGNEPDWEYDGTFSGRLPVWGRPSFLISYRSKKNMLIYPSMDRPYFLHNNLYAKLGWNLSKSIKLYSMGMYGETKTMSPGRSDGFRAYETGDPQNFSSLLFARDAFNQSTLSMRDMYRGFGSLSFTHTVSPRTYYKIQVTSQVSSFKQPHTRRRDPTAVFWIYQDYLTGEIYSTQNQSDIFDEDGNVKFPYTILLALDEQPVGLGSALADPAPSRYAMNMIGKNFTQDFSKMFNLDIRFDLTSQITKYFQLQTGLEYYTFDLRQKLTFGQEEPPRFQGAIANPSEINAYVNNKLELKDMVANIGLSFQIYDPNISWFDFLGGNKFNKENLDWRSFHTVEHEQYDYWDFWNDMSPMRTRKAEYKIYCSPRFGFSHPVSVAGKLFFSYGIYRQIPDTRDMYAYNERHRPNVTFLRMGNPFVEFPTTSISEIGYQHNVSNVFVVGLTAYFKSVEKALNRKEFYTVNRDVDYFISVNESWQRMHGFEISIQKPYGRWLTGWLNYNYMVYKSGHYGTRRECEDPRETENYTFIPEAPMAKPTARVSLSLSTPFGFGPSIWGFRPFEGYKANFLYRYIDGGKTRLAYADPEDPTEPYVDVVDMHLVNATFEKSVRFKSVSMTAYLEIRNLFNRKHLNLAGMDNLEEYEKSLKLPFEEGDQKGTDKIGDYSQSYIDLDPFWWGHFLNPRDWWFGIRFSF